jgi:hypothetical protein
MLKMNIAWYGSFVWVMRGNVPTNCTRIINLNFPDLKDMLNFENSIFQPIKGDNQIC